MAAILIAVAAGCGGGGEGGSAATTTAGAPPTTPGVPPTTAPPPPATTTTVALTTTPPPATTAPAGPATAVRRGDAARRMVALTFDAGADVGFTARILDTLDRAGIKASFGITGRWAEQHPDEVRRMAAAGHVIVNHSYDHRSYTGVSAKPALLSTAERRADVERADEIIRDLTGATTRPWFRSPYGDYDASVNAVLGSLGYRYNVLWTVDSLGWQGLSAAAITTRCLNGAVPGAILLFHVGSQSQDASALEGIIAGLRQAGYAFGTVADVVGG
jgi:peptidoglycan-N-acetylglucosamine deacetylase